MPEPELDAILQWVDYLTPNESELAALTSIRGSDEAALRAGAEALFVRGLRKAVIATLGARGSAIVSRLPGASGKAAEAQLVPAWKIGQPVDTTGAGDAFNGTLAVKLAEGESLSGAVRFANAAAALSVTRPGAAAAMPRRAETEALIARGSR